jgi:NADPH:quinone reductase-like Zn-dependent oxidoreductase
MALPSTTRAWSIREINKDSFDSLILQENIPLPKLGDHDVLVQIEAVSLNYRDLAIPKVYKPSEDVNTVSKN